MVRHYELPRVELRFAFGQILEGIEPDKLVGSNAEFSIFMSDVEQFHRLLGLGHAGVNPESTRMGGRVKLSSGWTMPLRLIMG